MSGREDDAPLPVSDVFFAMLRRDMRVARRELPFFLLRTTMQPLLLMVVFGYLLPKMGMVAKGYTATLLPGVVSLSLALSAVQSVSLPMVAQFGFSKEIEDLSSRRSRAISSRSNSSPRARSRVCSPDSSCCPSAASSWARFPDSDSRTPCRSSA